MTTENETTKRPSHIVWQVLGDDDKSRWVRIGAAWPNRDGKGFNLVLNAVPLDGRLVVRQSEQPEDDKS